MSLWSMTYTPNNECLLMYVSDPKWASSPTVCPHFCVYIYCFLKKIIINLMCWGWGATESTRPDRCPKPWIRTIYVGKHPWACRPPPLSLFLYFTVNRCKGKKVCGKEILKSQGTYQRVRKVKIKIAASKPDKTQNQYKACLISKQSLWSITSQLIQITRHPQSQTAEFRVHPKLGWKQASYRHGKQLSVIYILALNTVKFDFCWLFAIH